MAGFVHLFSLLTLSLIGVPTVAQPPDKPSRFIDVSLYPYQRTIEGDTDFTVTINGGLPGRFSYFSYSNFTGLVTDGSAAFNRSEQNLRYTISDKLPFDINAQAILARDAGNDYSQLGIGWRVHDTDRWQEFFERFNLIYRLTVQLKRFGTNDPGGWGLEHFFRLSFPNVSDRLYLSGFVDQAFDEDLPDFMPSRPIVAEIQLGVRVWDRFYAVGEFRVNERRVGDEHNFVVGIEYKFRL